MYDSALPSSGYLRLSHLIGKPEDGIPAIIPVSKATIWNWVKQGKFPKPLKLSDRITVWRVEDVREYIDGNK
ncbi:MAG: AlpA family phage regulatory protein [Acidiferrobacterales bacterium]|nr:AlpA family phage regulatory protein [Acidiferrobacterales bacterium]